MCAYVLLNYNTLNQHCYPCGISNIIVWQLLTEPNRHQVLTLSPLHVTTTDSYYDPGLTVTTNTPTTPPAAFWETIWPTMLNNFYSGPATAAAAAAAAAAAVTAGTFGKWTSGIPNKKRLPFCGGMCAIGDKNNHNKKHVHSIYNECFSPKRKV